VWWDERRPGGRLKSLLFLTHPGPSVLVTATFVAVAWMAAGHAPGPGRFVQLVFLMLPIQFAIGVANDLCGLPADRAAKAYKPLVRGAVDRRLAAVLAVVLAVGGLVSAATISWTVWGFALGGLVAGLTYDAGLARTPLSVVPWWAAFVFLPLAAFAAAGRATPWAAVLVPLSGLLAVSLQLANGLPDIDADRRAGSRSLPVLLGARRCRVLASASLAAAAIVAVDVAGPIGQRVVVVAAGAAVALVASGSAPWVGQARLFPILAPAAAVLAVTWLAVLPAG